MAAGEALDDGAPRRPRSAGWAVAIGVVAVVGFAAIVVAVRDDDANVATGDGGAPVAAVGDALLPPGTELAPGIEVQDGSMLVGTTFPAIDRFAELPAEAEPAGWQAVLVVDGPPLEVWQRYVQELGLAPNADARAACVVTVVAPPKVVEPVEGEVEVPPDSPPPKRFVTDDPLPGENRLDCSADNGQALMTMAVGTQRRCGRRQEPGDDECPPLGASHLLLRVYDEPPSGLGDSDEVTGTYGTDELRWDIDPSTGEAGLAPVPTGPLVAPQLDDLPPSQLPAPGERVDQGLDPFLDWTGARLVPDGARSLVAPAMLVPCNSGLVAVLEVPQAPADVVTAFDDAEPDDDDLLRSHTGTDARGRAMAGGEVWTAGGEHLEILAVDTGDATSTVLLAECGD